MFLGGFRRAMVDLHGHRTYGHTDLEEFFCPMTDGSVYLQPVSLIPYSRSQFSRWGFGFHSPRLLIPYSYYVHLGLACCCFFFYASSLNTSLRQADSLLRVVFEVKTMKNIEWVGVRLKKLSYGNARIRDLNKKSQKQGSHLKK